ncbi:hypothetical protein D3C75_609280 [compost metagenome]
MTAMTAALNIDTLQSASIGLMHDIYKVNPFTTQRHASLKPLQRGAQAAKALADCRRTLERVREHLAHGRTAEAHGALCWWSMRRREWAQLVGLAK